MASKRFKNLDCAYCGASAASTTGDHVIARSFFLKKDRADIPQVPACGPCNNSKSELEHYVAAALLAGSNLADGDRYRREFVKPRLAKNTRLQREMGVLDAPVLLNVNGIIQPMHLLRIEPAKVQQLMGLIATGLYHHHTGKPLSRDFEPHVAMFHPDHEAANWASFADYFPHGSLKVSANLGRNTFIYEGAVSPAHESFTIWRMSLHNGIRLHGRNSPPQGIGAWWVVTGPTSEALAAAEAVQLITTRDSSP